MRILRLILLAFMCVAIPLQGIAAMRSSITPCPMEQRQAQEVTDMDMHIADHDCCNDEETAAKTGKMCKTGQECQTGQMISVLLPEMVSPSPSSDNYSPLVLSARSFDTSNVWRPPAHS